MNMREEALERARNQLAKDVGNLRGVNPELANTIANIYYKYYAVVPKDIRELTMALRTDAARDVENSLYGRLTFPERVDRTYELLSNALEGMNPTVIDEYAFLSACVEGFPHTMELIRGMERKAAGGSISSTQRNMADEFFLSIFKYRIIDASSKSRLRCSMERKLKRKPDEIAGLANVMGCV